MAQLYHGQGQLSGFWWQRATSSNGRRKLKSNLNLKRVPAAAMLEEPNSKGYLHKNKIYLFPKGNSCYHFAPPIW